MSFAVLKSLDGNLCRRDTATPTLLTVFTCDWMISEFRTTGASPVNVGTDCGQQGDKMISTQTSQALTVQVNMNVNGEARSFAVEPRTTLLDALRNELGLTGPKKSCDRGECGACTVHIDGRRVLSCMTLVAMHDGQQITTIEGLERDGQLHPVQQAFIDYDGFQCGFCTSGQIMSAIAMIREAQAGWPSAATEDVTKPFRGADLSEAEIRERMSGNLCRCSCYPNIVDAIAEAARRT
jgi:xanthine dehydrogenase YagT iron-sulfur-binding subunit